MSVLATESSVHGWSIEHLDEKTIAGLVRRIDARLPVRLGNYLVGAGPRDQEWNAFVVTSRFFDANQSSLVDGFWGGHHLFRRQLENREGQRMRSFVSHLRLHTK